MKKSHIDYLINGNTHKAYLVHKDNIPAQAPAVLIAHDWSGCNEFAQKKAEQIAELGYIAFALDMFGEGKTAGTKEEKMALIEPFFKDRKLVSRNMLAALNTLKNLPNVDPTNIAAIGFCFGGLCALDLARSGAELRGVVSFHGMFTPPANIKPATITAKILMLHGYEDPMAPPEGLTGFADEMKAAQADWQVHFYGNVMHAFANPQANDPAAGIVYDKIADQRSWKSMKNFLEEIFN